MKHNIEQYNKILNNTDNSIYYTEIYKARRLWDLYHDILTGQIKAPLELTA